MMPPAVILIITMFFITACEANFLENSENETFSLAKAKEYSLHNASVFKFPTAKPTSKVATTCAVELEPLWEEAKYHEIHFPDKLAKTYEVPLEIGSGIGGLLLKNDNPGFEPAKISSSLVIQEFWQGEKKSSRQMIATIVGNDLNGEYSSAFTYMGSRASFSGFMVVSKVTGEIINIFQYINGARTVMYIKTDSIDNSKSSNEYYKGFRFLNIISTKSEEGNTIPGNCHMCGKETDVYPMYGHICAVCLDGSEFLDEVVVESERPDDTEDGGSGGGSGSNCNCWGDCECSQNGNMMCMCEPGDGPGTACSNCGELGCNGECPGPGGGSSGSSPSPETPPDLPVDGEWWQKGHEYITSEALSDYLTPENLDNINAGHRIADSNQGVDDAHMHAMLQPGQGVADGIMAMKQHFADYMVSFISSNNYNHLGVALHCIQDAYSPAHAMQVWNGINYLPHMFESIYIYQKEKEFAINATREIYLSIMNSDGSRASIEQIFDDWLNDYYDISDEMQ